MSHERDVALLGSPRKQGRWTVDRELTSIALIDCANVDFSEQKLSASGVGPVKLP